MRRAAVLAVAILLAFPASAAAFINGPTPLVPQVPAAPSASPASASVPAAPAPTSSSPGDPAGGILGTPDLFTQQDVNCQRLLGATAEVRRNCVSDAQPRSAYPASAYGLDVNVDTGLTNPAGDFASIVQNGMSGLFSLLVTVVGAVLSVLGWAFKFDLFRDALPEIEHSVGIATGSFSAALLPLSLLILGAVLARLLLVDHHTRVIGHSLLALLMIAVALIIAAHPGGTLGWLDAAANNTSSASVGLFAGTGASSGYANSEPALWRTAVETPWCVAEFGNQTWCNAPVDPAMAAARRDIIAHHLSQALGNQGNAALAKREAPLERTRMGDAATNGELFLSFLPNSNARNGKNDSWTFYNVASKEHPELLAIRGEGGWVQRGITLFFGSIVGILFLLVIGYAAVQIVVSSFILVACLGVTPFVLLLPVWEGGQRAFLGWLAWIGLSFARKVVYGLYLGLIVLLSVILGRVASSWGLTVYWFLLAVLFASAFALRKKPMGLIGVSEAPLMPSGQWAKSELRNRRLRRAVQDREENHYHSHYYNQPQPQPQNPPQSPPQSPPPPAPRPQPQPNAPNP